MSNDILDRLASANPIPDGAAKPGSVMTATALRSLIDDRRETMQTESTQTLEAVPPPPRRKPWLVAAAAFAAVIILVGAAAVIVASLGDEDDAATTTTLETAEEAAARAVVAGAFAAYNSGEDPSLWPELRHRGDVVGEINDAGDFRAMLVEDEIAHEAREQAAEHAAGAHIEVVQCTSSGWGEWPGFADDPVAGYEFVCETIKTDAFHDAAGIQLAEQYHWVVADGDVVAMYNDQVEADSAAWDAFMTEFVRWLEQTHPDAWDQIELVYDDVPDFSYPNPATVALALEYVAEFVASRS